MNRSISNRIKVISAVSLALASAGGSYVVAADGGASKWSQEVGYYKIAPDENSSAISGPGMPPATAVDVEDGSSYLFSTTYHHNNNLSVEFFYGGWNELDAAADGSISGLGNIGTFEYLAPTVTVNWTFGNDAWALRPHLGLGINRMIYGQEKANGVLEGALGGSTEIEIDDTWGAVFTAGLTWHFTKRLYATASYVVINSDTTATLTTEAVGTVRTVDLDTDLKISYLNFGYRF